MKGYAAIQTGLETRVKIFKTFEEASTQVKAWIGEVIAEIAMHGDKDEMVRYVEALEIYKEGLCFYVNDEDLGETTEIVEVDIPFV